MKIERVYKLLVSSVYPLYIQKVERKGRTQEELNEVIFWLTGYNAETFQRQLDALVDFETFFAEAPSWNPKTSAITGVICGYRVEDIADPLLQKIRYLDKLVDELAKGKSLDKILRK